MHPRSRSNVSRRQAIALFGGAPALLWLGGCGAADDPATAPPSNGAFIKTTLAGDRRTIECNDVPTHPTGTFPNAHCPFGIVPQRLRFAMSASPALASAITPIDGWLFGVAVNGVVFDPTGPFLYQGMTSTGWEFEVMSSVARPALGLDTNNAHSQPSGEYHYHGPPSGLLDQISATGRVTLLGYAADGFPIYASFGYDDPMDPSSAVREIRSGYQQKSGERPDAIPGGHHDGTFVQDYEWMAGAGDLDEVNGRFGVTPEYPGGIYHYVVTSTFPFIPRAWRGRPDPSFRHPSPGPNAVPPELRGYRGT